ncbi:MAG: aminopeptidase P family protein [Phycisphaeraceae bacterium]|nr:aminopeptidase P family protein [Phycisphaeraceae bacterium]
MAKGIGAARLRSFRNEYKAIEKILSSTPTVKKDLAVPTAEFKARQKRVAGALKKAGYDVGFVFSDEHYNGDVPYLGGNTNISIEQIAGVIGATGFHITAGLEGGYIAEQLAFRAGAKVHKVELLQLADEKYPIRAVRMEEVIEAAAGKPLSQVKKIALLTPRQVVPAGVVDYLNRLFGAKNVVDAQLIYQKIKNLKSDREMELIRDANVIADAMMRALLAVLRPGMLETEVAGWAYLVGMELGGEENGFDVMVGANEANRTLIGKALNRRINEGDWVHLGCAPKRDGLTSCIRRSVVAGKPTKDQRYWFDFVNEAYQVGYDAYVDIVKHNKPAKHQEQALVNYFRAHTSEVNQRFGLKLDDLSKLKPYTGTHNSGYTECQEFYGAITLESEEPLAKQVVTMLDVAIRGIGDHWHAKILPVDFVVVENTLGKFDRKVVQFNKVPNDCQPLVGKGI